VNPDRTGLFEKNDKTTIKEVVAERMRHNPEMVLALGAPLLFFLGHTFVENKIVRSTCGVFASCTMLAVTVLAVIAGRWNDLLWPGIGLVYCPFNSWHFV